MTKVFIGGSRQVSRLNADVKRRIDRIIEQRFPVLVGDANGADKAVQQYLHSRRYEAVEVFCSGGECRNNLGNWRIRTVATGQTRKDFDYYTAKDEQMAQEASVGLMIWDGKSAGTLANAARLVRQHKKVVVYATPTKRFLTLKAEADWEHLLSTCGSGVREKILRSLSAARSAAEPALKDPTCEPCIPQAHLACWCRSQLRGSRGPAAGWERAEGQCGRYLLDALNSIPASPFIIP